MFFSVCHIYAQLVYHDASKFPLLGKATEATGARYERLPDSLKNISRAPLWNLSRNSAGMAIRFRSNSTTIAAKWETLINFHMNHMTDTGAKGLDLYVFRRMESGVLLIVVVRVEKQIKQQSLLTCDRKRENICFIFLFTMVLFLCL